MSLKKKQCVHVHLLKTRNINRALAHRPVIQRCLASTIVLLKVQDNALISWISIQNQLRAIQYRKNQMFRFQRSTPWPIAVRRNVPACLGKRRRKLSNSSYLTLSSSQRVFLMRVQRLTFLRRTLKCRDKFQLLPSRASKTKMNREGNKKIADR